MLHTTDKQKKLEKKDNNDNTVKMRDRERKNEGRYKHLCSHKS